MQSVQLVCVVWSLGERQGYVTSSVVQFRLNALVCHPVHLPFRIMFGRRGIQSWLLTICLLIAYDLGQCFYLPGVMPKDFEEACDFE